MNSTPLWADAITALLVTLGGIAALVGSLGLLRLRTFFQRVHAPTLGATVGTWTLTLATLIQASFVAGHPHVHVLLTLAFIVVTAPITTVFLMRAALFRSRQRREPGVPLVVGEATRLSSNRPNRPQD
jgi:multicomponent K+:H+ antiporter subunit G